MSDFSAWKAAHPWLAAGLTITIYPLTDERPIHVLYEIDPDDEPGQVRCGFRITFDAITGEHWQPATLEEVDEFEDWFAEELIYAGEYRDDPGDEEE